MNTVLHRYGTAARDVRTELHRSPLTTSCALEQATLFSVIRQSYEDRSMRNSRLASFFNGHEPGWIILLVYELVR